MRHLVSPLLRAATPPPPKIGKKLHTKILVGFGEKLRRTCCLWRHQWYGINAKKKIVKISVFWGHQSSLWNHWCPSLCMPPQTPIIQDNLKKKLAKNFGVKGPFTPDIYYMIGLCTQFRDYDPYSQHRKESQSQSRNKSLVWMNH